jgi:3-hydroxybutyryl-CoA dehydrogenase
MGYGMAMSYAQAGYQVSLFSRTQTTLDKAGNLMKSALNTMAQEGLVDGSQITQILELITMTTSLEEGARDADIAVETVAENRDVKKEIFAQLDTLCPPQTIFASNTSFLNIFDFIETSRPEKILIAHWFEPPHLIPLVEVVKGPQTDQANIDLMVRMLQKMGKKPAVMLKFLPGFILNRLQIAFQRECLYMIDEDYITPQELDEAAKYGLALRMLVIGIMQRMDFGGIDLSAKNLNNPNIDPVPLDYKPKKLFELVEQGHLGVKTGKGWYDYSSKTQAEWNRERDIGLIQLLKTIQ